MKTIKIIFLAFTFLGIMNACSAPEDDNAALGVLEDDENRGAKKKNDRVKLDPKRDFVALEAKGKSKDAEAFVAKAAKDSLEIAAKSALEGVLLHFQETEIDDNMLVFGLESELNKNLSLELIGENGELYIAVEKINIPSTLVFKAIKLNKVKEGKYYFILKDETAKELVKKIKVKH